MRPAARHALLGLAAVALSGCVSLLPKTNPSHLYRFGLPAAPAAERASAVAVFRAGGRFQREAAGDRILTITGDRAAYIAEVRWVAPAEALFDEAVATAFEAAPGVRLVTRGESVRAQHALRLDVRNFETRYDAADPEAPPTVLIRIRAVFVRGPGAGQVSERIFEAQAHAERNRVSAIVPAYNEALAKVLGDVVAWTNALAS
jgi:cholesterol transport system auxiliary component